jgi:site-specific DNA recombinase
MTIPAALYARVSSDHQKEQHTIDSQVMALIQYAETHGYWVPPEWRFQDDGYSGATLVRPGLEAVRDLAAQGQIEAVLVYSPDRLSRKYAYQVVLAEELTRCGVQLVFVRGPAGTTPEDALLAQFQGMIAEYERAQILERSRRGKRYRAQHGAISVLSGAPYGYRYVKKSDTATAYYEIVEAEAEVVRWVFDAYIREGFSINAIARGLTERAVPPRRGTTHWQRSTVWGMLRNPAYSGCAGFGKTEGQPRQRITRPLRQRGGISTRPHGKHGRPRHEWIHIPVPAIISETTFARAQEQLEQNKRHARRRTIEPSLLQGMLVCATCGYALHRTSTAKAERRLYYYRCYGTERYRHLKGAPCDTRPIRQDYLDTVVWNEVLRLLDDPRLLNVELDRRRAMAQSTSPLTHREEALRRDEARLTASIDRLVTAYQDGLLTLDQLRGRVSELRHRHQGVQAELRSLAAATTDDTRYLRLVETLADFRTRLQGRSQTLPVRERQKILRLVVKEILVGPNTLTIRHSIPLPDDSESNGHPRPGPDRSLPKSGPNFLLRSGSLHGSLRKTASRA